MLLVWLFSLQISVQKHQKCVVEKLAHHGGITFETQTAPGQSASSAFGSIHLKAGTAFETVTEFKIKTREE